MSQYEAGLAARLLLKDGTVTSIQGRVEESRRELSVTLPQCLTCVYFISINAQRGCECRVSVDIVIRRARQLLRSLLKGDNLTKSVLKESRWMGRTKLDSQCRESAENRRLTVGRGAVY